MSDTGRLTLKEAPIVEKCYFCETHNCIYCEHFNRIIHRLYNLENHFESLKSDNHKQSKGFSRVCRGVGSYYINQELQRLIK